MQGLNRNYNTIVIRNLEKQVELKMIQMFLTVSKVKDQVKTFNKIGNQITLEFIKQESAALFIQQHNHVSKIMLKKFNISYSFFANNAQQSFPRFQVLGVKQQNRRQIYDICKAYGHSHFNITYEGKKLNPSMIIYFQQIALPQIQELKQKLQTCNIKLRAEDSYGDFDKFRCSIELYNFAQISSQNISKKEEEELKKKVLELIQTLTQQSPVGLQFHSYPHSQGHKVKAFFRFNTVQQTFSIYEKIRQALLKMPESVCSRLYYFQKDANSFYTLFTNSLINTQQLSSKNFEEQLLQAFRKVNPNITQILLNLIEGTYTGKIYFKTQADGKDFIAIYTKKRQNYYMFYKPGVYVAIDIFQTQKEIKNQYKYQKNANDMLAHFQYHKSKYQKAPIIPLAPGIYPKPQFNHAQFPMRQHQDSKNNFKKTNKYQYRERQPKYGQKNQQNQQKFKEKKQSNANETTTKKVEKKPQFKLVEEDFPGL